MGNGSMISMARCNCQRAPGIRAGLGFHQSSTGGYPSVIKHGNRKLGNSVSMEAVNEGKITEVSMVDFPAICHGNPVAVEGKSEFRQAKFGECLKYLKGAARKQVLEALHPKKNHGASAGSCADMELPGVFFGQR